MADEDMHEDTRNIKKEAGGGVTTSHHPNQAGNL